MIVPSPVARKLVAGKATQVRVPAHSQRCPFREGGDYAIQPHRVEVVTVDEDDTEYEIREIDREIGRVVIVAVRRARLGDLTYEDARREGFHTRDEHHTVWKAHRRNANPDQPVWVLTVRPHADVVRLLAPAARPGGRLDDRGEWQGSELGYVSNYFRSMADEPEAVDVAALSPEWAQRSAAQHDAALRDGSPGQRLDRALALARARGVDVTHLERAAEQRIRALETKARNAA